MAVGLIGLPAMKRIGTVAAAIVIGVLCQTGSAGQQPADDSAVAAIKTEGRGRSQAPRLFHTLTDVMGPRLSGSPGHLAAARWAVDRF
jgi:hypothetical protein